MIESIFNRIMRQESTLFFLFFAFLLITNDLLAQSRPGNASEAQIIPCPVQNVELEKDEPKFSAEITAQEQSASEPVQTYSMEECVNLALQNNLEIQAQKKSLEGAFHKVREQLTLAKPQIVMQNLYSLQGKIPGFGEAKLGDTETNISQVTLKQPLYSFGRLESGIRMVRELYKAEDSTFMANRVDIIHRVIRGFLDVLKAGNRVRIARETIQVLQEHLRLVESLFQAGVVLNTDVSTTKVKVLEARQRLIEERNSCDMAQLGLCDLLHLPGDTIVGFQEIPPMPRQVAVNLKNTDQQPEMENLSHLIEAGKNRYSIEKRGKLPMVGLQYTYSTGNQFLEKFKNWNAVVVLEVPVFDSGLSRARKEQAKAGLEQLQYLRAAARQKFSLAIQQSARKVQEMQEKFVLAQQIDRTATENYANLQNQFKEGAVINTDVLSAQLTLTSAKLGLTNAYYDYIAYLADHFRCLGNIDEFLQLVERARKNVLPAPSENTSTAPSIGINKSCVGMKGK